jgi:hypothetical protein
MTQSRTLLLFDPDAQPQCWNERMAPGEYAVLYSSTDLAPPGEQKSVPMGGPFCTVFGSLSEADEHAREQVRLLPTLRCRIYNHEGLGREPVLEIRGAEYKGESEISARFRRWGGSVLFFGGLGLTILDWSTDFSLSWPAMIGTRMLPVGLILLVIELAIVIEARRKKSHVERIDDDRR